MTKNDQAYNSMPKNFATIRTLSDHCIGYRDLIFSSWMIHDRDGHLCITVAIDVYEKDSKILWGI